MPKGSTVRLTKRVVDAVPPGGFAWDSECRGFGFRVTLGGSKSFLFRYRAHKRQRYLPLGSYPALTVEKAREKAEARRAERNVDHRAVLEAAEEERRKAKTFADLEAHYLETYAKARALRPATLRDARGVLRLVPDATKGRKLGAITTADLRGLHGDARGAAGVYQANRLLAVLSKMFSLAGEEGWRTGDNPCRGVRKFPEDQRWRNLTSAEVGRLLDACDEYVGLDPAAGQNAANAVRLLLFTGARLQEALKAEWAEFDLEAGLWSKPSAHTKTKRQHRLELDGPALDLLRDMRRSNPDGRYLFPGEPGTDEQGQPVERPRADLKRPWRWIARRAGLEGVRLHDLRRTTASFMLSGGASLATVGKALGHTQAATTARYAHLAESVQREELKRAGERMVALRKGNSESL